MGIFSQKTAPCCICGADANGLHRVKDGVLCERCYRRAESYLRIRTKKALSLGNDFKEVTGTDAARTRTADQMRAWAAFLAENEALRAQFTPTKRIAGDSPLAVDETHGLFMLDYGVYEDGDDSQPLAHCSPVYAVADITAFHLDLVYEWDSTADTPIHNLTGGRILLELRHPLVQYEVLPLNVKNGLLTLFKKALKDASVPILAELQTLTGKPAAAPSKSFIR